jgi:hypothetical protein
VSAKSLLQGEGSITNSAGSDAAADTVVRTLASIVFSIDAGRGESAKHAREQIVHSHRRGVTPRKTGSTLPLSGVIFRHTEYKYAGNWRAAIP